MVFENIAEYQIWANQRYRDLIASIAEDDYEKDVIGRNIRGISSHIVAALTTCFFVFEESFDNSVYEKLFEENRAELMLRWKELDERLRKMIQDEPKGFVKVSHVSENPIGLDSMDFLLQYVLHTNHHRGQLGLILRNLGYDVPPTDYLHFFADKS